jgi:hypothetical protein
MKVSRIVPPRPELCPTTCTSINYGTEIIFVRIYITENQIDMHIPGYAWDPDLEGGKSAQKMKEN